MRTIKTKNRNHIKQKFYRQKSNHSFLYGFNIIILIIIIFFRGLYFIGKFFFGGIIKKSILLIYRSYILGKRYFKKRSLQDKLIYLFSQHSIIPLLIIFFSFFIIKNNLQARDYETFGEKTILYALTAQDELGYIIAENVDLSENDTPNSKYITQGTIGNFGQGTINNNSTETDTFSSTQGGSVVSKPSISGFEDIKDYKIQYYIVQDGDTISAIAEKFDISINTIIWENNLTSRGVIRPGQKLTILPVSGVRYTVKRGDTISSIAKKYDISPDDIFIANNLGDNMLIAKGDILMLPGASKSSTSASTTAIASKNTSSTKESSYIKSNQLGKYIWPTSCRRITQYFTWKHTGLDVACPLGQPIYAVSSGKVIRAQYGWNGGYGNVIIIDHGNGIQTLYGHSQTLFVKLGDTVEQGDVISAMGSTGRSTGSHVHFEVRQSTKKLNPLGYVK